MKKETLQRLTSEVKACRRYTLNAIKKAEEGKLVRLSACSTLHKQQKPAPCKLTRSFGR